MILLTVVGSGTHHFDELFNSQAPLVIAWLLLKSRHQIGEHTKRIHCLFIACSLLGPPVLKPIAHFQKPVRDAPCSDWPQLS
jgi:hypothetical protein